MSRRPSVHIELLVSCSTEFCSILCWGYLMNSKECIVSHSHPRVINLTGWAYFLTCCSFSSPAELVFSLTKLIFWQAPAVFSHRLNLFSHRLNLYSHWLNLFSGLLQQFFLSSRTYFLTGWCFFSPAERTVWPADFTIPHRIMIQDWWPGRGRKLLCPVSRHCPPPSPYHVEKLKKAMSNWSEEFLCKPRSEEYMSRQEANMFSARASLYFWPKQCVCMQRYR